MRGREEEKGKERTEPRSRTGSRGGRSDGCCGGGGGRGADACSWVAARCAAVAGSWRLCRPRGWTAKSTGGLELGGGASAPRTRCPTGPRSKRQTEAPPPLRAKHIPASVRSCHPGCSKSSGKDLRLLGLPTRQPNCSATPPLAPVRLRSAVGFIELDFSPPQPHHLHLLSPVSPPPPQFPPPRPSFPPSSPSPGHFANLWLL